MAEQGSRYEILDRHPSLFRAARLEFAFPRAVRIKVLKISLLLALFSLALSLLMAIWNTASPLRFLGLFLFFLGPAWLFLLVEFYFLSTSRPVPFIRARMKEEEKVWALDLDGARRLMYLDALRREEINAMDLYGFFSGSTFLQLLILRLGIPPADFNAFVEGQNKSLPVSRDLFFETLVYEAHTSGSSTIGAREFMLLLFDLDKNWEKFLFERKIRKQELLGASQWIAAVLERDRSRARFWERSVLSRIPTMGQSLAFGYTYVLDRYAHDLSAGKQGSIVPAADIHRQEIKTIEEILSRSGQTNVMLVGEPGSGKESILEEIARMIMEERIMPALAHKRLVVLDTSSLTATAKDKGSLEELTIRLMNEAVSAGNIILVIENFPELLRSGLQLGVDFAALLEPYLEGDAIQVAALADSEQFHKLIEPNAALMKLFEKVDVQEPAVSSAVYILEEAALALEARSNVVITYQALLAAADLADRYITTGAMPEKAIDLLDRAVVMAETSGKEFVGAEEVEQAVEDRTHIPVGKAQGKEAEKLLNLEKLLHARVIGQDAAINAIANALRRARAGLHTGTRPIGSFLFLGPTGVGKTETAKAISEVYFGSEDAMIRFDMSEFQGPEGVNKLIGSFQSQEPGVLANALREKPFSLLLFDEFEKSSREVVNLFLQILEEGFFTDALGHRVSARECMIICTSNAGANLIWDLLKAGKDPSTLQKEVVDAIRQQGIFSPEILNRYDAIITFHPLGPDHLHQVANLLLQDLAQQLKEQDIELVITQVLIDKIVEIGYDPTMGARPMRRAIADRVEQVIAKRLLDGSLQRGGKLEFTPLEIEKL